MNIENNQFIGSTTPLQQTTEAFTAHRATANQAPQFYQQEVKPKKCILPIPGMAFGIYALISSLAGMFILPNFPLTLDSANIAGNLFLILFLTGPIFTFLEILFLIVTPSMAIMAIVFGLIGLIKKQLKNMAVVAIIAGFLTLVPTVATIILLSNATIEVTLF